MALVKRISELPAKAEDLGSTDLYPVAVVDGTSPSGYTTEYVTGQEVTNGVQLVSNRSVSTFPHTLSLGDGNKFLLLDSSSVNTTTIPTNAAVAFPVGMRIEITQEGSGQSRIVPDTGVTLKNAGGADKLIAQYSCATLIKTSADEWYLFGDITT